MLRLKEVRRALDGVDGAYLCYPLADGLVEATTVFAQAAREAKVGHVVNMSRSAVVTQINPRADACALRATDAEESCRKSSG